MTLLQTIKFWLLVLVRLSWIFVNHVVHFPADLCWMLLLQPLRWLHPDLYWTAESYLYRWILALVAAWGWGVGHRVVEYGEDIYACSDARSIMLCNHQTTADVPVLMGLLQNKHKVVNNIMWIMDRIFKYTHFGFVADMHRDYFIQQGKDCRESELLMLAEHIENFYYPLNRKWIVLFPEGGFLYKRLASSQAFAKKNDLPVLHHVTLPRVGALQTLLQAMTGPARRAKNGIASGAGEDQSVKYIIDITLGYPDQEPLDFLSFAAGTKGAKKIHVYYRYYSVDAIPIDTDGLTKWLYDRYVEKEYLLAELYRTGAYPVLESEHNRNKFKIQPREIIDSKRWFVVMHAFFLASAYFFVVVFYRIYSSLQQWFF